MTLVNPSQVSSTDATTSAGYAPGQTMKKLATVKSFEDIQRADPDLAYAMMEAIAQQTGDQLKKTQDNIHRMNKEAQNG